MSEAIENMETWDGIPEWAARFRGDPALPLGSTPEGWWYETQDGQRWFVPNAVASTIHRAAHLCPGGCSASTSFTDWPERGIPTEGGGA